MTMNTLNTNITMTGLPTAIKQRGNKWNPFNKSKKGTKASKKETTAVGDDGSIASTSSCSSNPQDKLVAPSPAIGSTASIPAKVGVLSTEDYGYGDATPEQEDYGYGDVQPDSAAADMYGYGDAAPDHDEPAPRQQQRRTPRRSSMPVAMSGPTPRRSSMKMAGMPRRNSIEFRGEVEIDLPPSRKGEGRQRVVRRTSLSFNEVATVKKIEPAMTLAGGANDLWFQKDEMDAIRKKVTALIVKTSQGQCPDSGKRYCMRGLEKYMQPEALNVKRNQAWDSVMNEQYLQKEEGIFEENHLANLYKFSVLRSQKDAVQRASEDEQEIAAYLSSTRRMCRRMSM